MKLDYHSRMLADYVHSLRPRDWISLFAISLFVSACGVFGVSYVAGKGWPILDLASEIALTFLFTFVFAILFMLADSGLAKLATKQVAKSSTAETRPSGMDIPQHWIRFAWLYRATPQWSANSVIVFAGIMMFFWIPWLIANFPGSTYWDTYYQIFQVYPENHPIAVIPWAEIYHQTLTDAWLVDHHPIVTTLVYGAFGWLSDQLTGNWMMGVFAFVCIQGILHVIAFTAATAYFRKIGCPVGLVFCCYVYFCIMPFVSTWALCMVKDSFFGLFFIPYFMMLFEAVRTKGKMLQRTGNVVLFSLCALMLCLTKKTGIFVVIPTALVLMCALHIRCKPLHLNGVERAKIATGSFMPALASIVVTCVIFPFALFPTFNIEAGGKQEVLGPLFQQTARYIVDYGSDVTPEEKEIIDKVLDYDRLESNYQFDFEDSVKYRYSLDATPQDIADYLQVYLQQGLKHPDAYFGAFMGLAGFYVAPTAFANIRMVTVDTKMGPDNRYMLWNPDELDWLRNGMDDLYGAIGRIPGLNLPLLIVTYAFWIPAALLFFALRRRVPYLTLFVPFLVLLLFCIIAPVYDARYVVPIFDGIPLLVMAMVYGFTASGTYRDAPSAPLD